MGRTRLLIISLALVCLAALGSQSTIQSSRQVPAARIPQNLGVLHPRLSSDGKWIAVSFHGAIWKLPRSGGALTRLTNDIGIDIEPAWSPDGKTIAYVHSSRMAGGDVRLIREDGSPVPMTLKLNSIDSTYYSKIEFHPDGRLLGRFQLDGKDLGLALVDLATGAATPLGKPGRFGLSPDGKWLVYAQTMETPGNQWGNDGPQSDLWKVATTGGEPEKLLRFPSRVYDICWAADGQSLYVVSDQGTSHNDLWQVPLRHPEQARRITSGMADEERPSVSSDQRWLAYTDNRRGTTSLMLRDLESDDDSAIPITSLDFLEPTGTFKIRTIDETTRQPVTARVSIRHERGKFAYPLASLHRLLRDDGHFYCVGAAELAVPVGRVTYVAFRGPEYRPVHGEIDIPADRTTEITIELKRWTNQAQQSWYSGENHIHANYGYGQWYNTPESMLDQCSGEDLRVCNFMVANSDTDAVFDREFFRGQPDPNSTNNTLLYWNQEFRSTSWGHMTLLNLNHLVEPIFTGFKSTTNPWDIPTNSDIADRTHLQNGLVNYTHAANNPRDPFDGAYSGKSIPVDVALGKIDTLDLNNSYAGSVPLWYRLLNCGFHLPAAAGTDCFLNRIPSVLPGADRVYVKIDGEFSYAAWIEGCRAGRSFVTSGPMLRFAADGLEPGSTLKLAAPRQIKVVGQATAQFPMSAVEVIFNGNAVHTAQLSDGGLSGDASFDFDVRESGWILLRAEGPSHRDHSGGPFVAYANPVYIEVAGKRAASKADAEFFLAWIDRLSLFLKQRDRIPDKALKAHVELQLESARTVYAEIAKRAQ